MSSSSVGWPSNSSLNDDELRMDKRSTLEVHQLFFDQLNVIANRGHSPLKGHWFNGINSQDECAIRDSMDAALAKNKWEAAKAFHLYAKALKEHLPGGSCGFAHTSRIQALILNRLASETLQHELSTIDLARGVNIIGDQNNVNVSGDHNILNVIGHGNQVVVSGNHNHQGGHTHPVEASTWIYRANAPTTANPNNSDVLGLRENAFP